MTDTEDRYVDDPTRDARVAALLCAAAAPVEPGPLPGEDAAVAAFGAVHHRPGRPHMRSSLISFKAGLAAAVGAGVLLTGGAAAAATGSLPDGAQSTAQSVLGSLGISVPGPNSQNANDHARQQHGQSADHVPTTDETSPSPSTELAGKGQETNESSTDPTDGQGKGSEISKLATTTTLTGVDKGAAISKAASGGKSQAGADHTQTGADHSQAGADHSQAGDHQPAGDQGATGKQHQPQVSGQGSDAAGAGQTKAAEASSGRSSAGTATAGDASGSPRP